jgi:hypothetical protein
MNENVDVPDKFDEVDRAGAPRVDGRYYPGIINPPIRGSHKPRSMAPYRR